QPEFDFQRRVVITGEVRYPGRYALRTKTDRLVDVINRAGGLTAQAYAEGILFIRSLNAVGRINVNLPRALRDTTSRYNILLQRGDSLHIPEYLPSVMEAGDVDWMGRLLRGR